MAAELDALPDAGRLPDPAVLRERFLPKFVLLVTAEDVSQLPVLDYDIQHRLHVAG